MGSERRRRIVSSLALASLVILLAIFITRESEKVEKNQIGLQTRNQHVREPASIQKVFDFSNLQGSALETASKQRLLTSVVVSRSGEDTVVELGNYVLPTENNDKDFACGYYDQVTLEFDAEGVAVSGEKPHIVLRTNCDIGENINSFSPIHIPVGKLKAQAPAESEYKFYNGKNPVNIQLKSAPPQWPGQWVLTDMKLSNSQTPSRILHINTDEIRANTGSVKMNW